jgi:hypothetical protein
VYWYIVGYYLCRKSFVLQSARYIEVLDTNGADAESLDIPSDVLCQRLHEGHRTHHIVRTKVVGKATLHQMLVQELLVANNTVRSDKTYLYIRLHS